jgi:hypothetical protein
MAQKVQIILTDDIDGGEAAETVSFSIDGAAYEIDLSEANAAKLRSALHPFMRGGRRFKAINGARSTRRTGASAASNGRKTGEIRAWAREQGITVNDRGRIPVNVIERYRAAH